MGNLLQYTDKSITIDNKLNTLLAQINYDYQNGNIRTETEYYYRIKNMLSQFYQSLTKPTFKFRPAKTTPISDEYNAMITESYNDMEYIIKDCEALSKLVSQSFANAEISRDMMMNQLSYISKKITAIGESIAKNQSTNTVVFTELFNDTEMTGNKGANNACNVNTTDGILTLRVDSSMPIGIEAIQIDNEVSNGFPGNTHCVDTMNGEMHFVGKEGLHNNLKVITKGVADQWFEFELFSITDETRKACNSYGFEYDEGVSWINNDDILRLKLIVVPKSSDKCSWITISPYLSDIKGVKPCFLEKCEIVTVTNNIYEICKGEPLNDTLVLPFPPQEIQRIELTFVQPSKYLTKVGHFYYTMVDTSSMSVFQSNDYTDSFTRVDGRNPSVSLLGVKYNPTTQWIDYPNTMVDIPNQDFTKDNLFSLPASTIEKKANQEIIDAYRYMIGIKSIKLSSPKFDKSSKYISTVFTTDDVITSITLESDEYIPGNDPEILKYFISLNGGITWHPIYPMHRAYSGIYKYYVNNDSIENLLSVDTQNRRSKNLTIAKECKSVQLKIEMKRPTGIENEEYATPIVYQYKLRLTTGGETIEY